MSGAANENAVLEPTLLGANRPPDPNLLQRRAADPGASVWVGASAGTGKTKVLTDRVLRLLLAGTAPERILCLTFTKAAAAEMANRLNETLAEWASAEDSELIDRLAKLTGTMPDEAMRHAARRLFARVLDAAGGMKIQTIHAFCQSLLGRFPLEAGLTPNFEVMEERTAGELLQESRAQLLIAARLAPESPLGRALSRLARALSEDEFGQLLSAMAAERGRVRRILARHGGVAGTVAAVFAQTGVAPDEDEESVLQAACGDGSFDGAGLRHACRALSASKSDVDRARGLKLQDWLDAASDRHRTFEAYRLLFLTEKGTVRKTLLVKEAAGRDPAALAALEAEAERLLAVGRRLCSVTVAQSTAALLIAGEALIAEYDRRKEQQGQLDFDDLVLRTRALLNGPYDACAWVLFKLDGGLDHILVDEAQDTNPDQWAIVSALADEFFAGIGAGRPHRSLFVVGDDKQSIFSFQRADPAEFNRMRRHFAERVRAAEERWSEIDLAISFRSTSAVLSAVDTVFALPAARAGVGRPDLAVQHLPFRAGMAGRVELWPLVAPRDAPLFDSWEPPLQRRDGDDPAGRLARILALQIKAWIDGGERLEARDRAMRPGDILVLVRRRTAFVEQLVRALKEQGVDVAGIDRMVLGEQLSVMDLMALGRFLLLPEDDLTLAELLKSPLVGLSEAALFELAHPRPGHLWLALVAAADHVPALAPVRAWLGELLGRADHERPYELFARVLAEPCPGDDRSGRRAMLGRLGPDAADPIDEFLASCLQFERDHAPSLQGFLHWLDATEAEIKREQDADRTDGPGQVRIMTVHGSKGLQAPVVILPDTTATPDQTPSTRILWPDSDDVARSVPLFAPRRALEDAACAAARARIDQRRDEEYRRLLYVALTRAEDRLYVCGWQGARPPSDGSWYRLVERALGNADGIERPEFDFTRLAPTLGWRGPGLRLRGEQTVPPQQDGRGAAAAATPLSLPAWIAAPAPAEPSPTQPLTPSRVAGADPPARSPLAGDDQNRFQRGILIHKLLQILPGLPAGERAAAADAWLARPLHRLAPVQQAEISREVMAILQAPEFSALFGPTSQAEVPIVATLELGGESRSLAGQIDRLAVAEDAVWIVDYKTHRPPPLTEAGVPPSYRAQMAAYREVLQRIYPGRDVRCLLLWTDGPRAMELSF